LDFRVQRLTALFLTNKKTKSEHFIRMCTFVRRDDNSVFGIQLEVAAMQNAVENAEFL